MNAYFWNRLPARDLKPYLMITVRQVRDDSRTLNVG